LLSRNIDRADDLVQETPLRAAPGATEMADRSCRAYSISLPTDVNRIGAMTQDYTITPDVAPISATEAREPLHPKTITVFLDAGQSGKLRARHAVALAQRWDAHLVGVHVVYTTEALHPWDSFAVGETAIKEVITREDKAHAHDEAVASRMELQFRDLCSSWNTGCEFRLIGWERPGEEAVLSALHSDLVITGHPEPNGLPGNMSAETILLASGTPLMVLPNGWPDNNPIGDNVLIAWNASREARRAVSDAMIFISAAKAVTVLVVDQGKKHQYGEEPGAEIALQLARHGARVNVDRVAPNGSSIAEAILSYGMQSRSDLLVFGAYSHARIRERLLGGTTRTLLARTQVPLLVSR
jgi:nucleotide-binding universal stress UspA family protein